VVWLRAAVELAAATVLAWRLLRVAQREHYVPGSVLATLQRWFRVDRVRNNLVLVAALLFIVRASWGDTPWLAVAGSVLVAAAPLGLRGFRGSPPLKWTARVVRLDLLLDAVAGLVVLVAWLSGVGIETSVAIAVFALPVWIELALAVAKPLEARLLLRFVRPAEQKLRRLAPDVVAITGSFGKTSVKEHVRDLVGRQRQVTASPASFNNQAGLARTVNDHLTPGTDVLVCEMGTYGRGEIAEMCRWVRPRIAAICRIGPVHLERMKTLENIRDAKAEILDGAEVAVLNVDDPLLAELADERRAAGQQVVGTSTSRIIGADVVVEPTPDGATVVVDGAVVAEGVAVPTGVHPSNVALAVGCGVALGVDPAALAAGIPALMTPTHRLDPATNDAGLVVLDDTFNSNPSGARAALEVLAVSGADGGRRVVVTPGMVELGDLQAAENELFARSVAEAGAELVVVGKVNRQALEAGYDAGRPPVLVKDRAEAVAWVRSELGPGDAVLYENDLPDHYP
jgi:UDP-N-acetylmuramoyl-tripeptide--D-alanyl-D-alanine ligase